jgi:hypothetical protein
MRCKMLQSLAGLDEIVRRTFCSFTHPQNFIEPKRMVKVPLTQLQYTRTECNWKMWRLPHTKTTKMPISTCVRKHLIRELQLKEYIYNKYWKCCFHGPPHPFRAAWIVSDNLRGIHKAEELHTKLRGFSPQANYTDRATAACRRS